MRRTGSGATAPPPHRGRVDDGNRPRRQEQGARAAALGPPPGRRSAPFSLPQQDRAGLGEVGDPVGGLGRAAPWSGCDSSQQLAVALPYLLLPDTSLFEAEHVERPQAGIGEGGRRPLHVRVPGEVAELWRG